MTDIVRTIISSYNDLMENRSDQRVKDWFMMSSPFPTLLICLCYAYFVKRLGPRLMANRKPFVLRRTILVYNLIQVCFSIYIFNESIVYGWGGKYSFRCQPIDYSDSPDALRMARICWLYYISKFIEFADTIFFVLRKKNNQITTLHVIHHGVVPFSVWFGVKFTPGGQSTFFGMLNVFVHIWMYGYYFLAALGPSVQRYLWWKKYLTTLQIVQFVLVVIHSGQLLFIDCDYPKAFVWWIGMHACLFFFLFRSFYMEAYVKKSAKRKDAELELTKHKEAVDKLQQNRLEKGKSSIYADDYRVATGYISDEGLRNRVYIDKNRSSDDS
ncbi:elongation of very long chain fatty acids protein AAEL008004-like [Venturia canescens]|uniref:elongation of very long chain fatty acids protein AAEL008004-like n=1 Tax=Venturia canescens TaxID=32260 RepID=UPI001C9D30C5|nr:elongation of very long chain fatty acids protein AAEL008004-like [Venturia canescens]